MQGLAMRLMNAVVKPAKCRGTSWLSILLLTNVILVCSPAQSAAEGTTGSVKVIDLKCDYLTSPEGIDHQTPNFGWVMESDQRGQKQTAYQILVTSSNGEQMWDSGKVTSSESSHVKYAGRSLQSSSNYYWKVRIWDKDDQVTEYTAPSHFGTALMDASEWKAKWIGRGPSQEPRVRWGTAYEQKDVKLIKDMQVDAQSTLLRKQVLFAKPVRNAKAFISGLGLYEFYVNGTKMGKSRELVPLETNYLNQVLYNSYDITDAMVAGSNAFGVMLGNGMYNTAKEFWGWRMQWWGSPKAIVQIHIKYMDGTEQIIVSDQSWKASRGPVLSSCMHNGEDYDARLEQPGWDQPAFDESKWQAANLVQAPEGKLVAQMAPSVTVMETIEPKSVQEVKPGVFVFDMGQNFAGWTRISCKGPAGAKIQLRHAENINADGTLNRKTIRNAKNTDTYTLRGDGKLETYEPHFTNHGFQYVEVTGYPGTPSLQDVQGCVASSGSDLESKFECSDASINHLYHCAFWTHRSLMQGNPTGCPQRDERMAWTADALIMAEGNIYMFDSHQFFAKWFSDIQLQQDPETGNLPYVCPRPGYAGYPAWSSAYVIMNWYCYQYYGDKDLLERHYGNMKRYVDYLQTESSGHIQPRDGSGDWKSLAGITVRGGPLLISTAFYYYNTKIVADAAKALGKTNDADKYAKMAEDIAYAFNNVFQHDKRNGYKYGENSQCENAAPLFLGIVPEETRNAVLKNLLDDIEKRNTHLTTGFHGTKWLMEALPMYDRADVAYKLLTQTTHPSWMSMVKGRTTFSESWDAIGGTNNHAGLGGPVSTWLFKVLAGINADPENPGFEKVLIKPYMPKDLSYIKASTYTIKGLVESCWQRFGEQISLKISIPVNSTALVYLPVGDRAKVKGPVAADASSYIRYQGKDEDAVVYQTMSGQYEFVFDAN